MYVKITFSNGYCGCDKEEYLKVESMNIAISYAHNRLMEYGQLYEYIAQCDTEEETEEYYDNCDFDIMEIEEEEFFENDGIEW